MDETTTEFSFILKPVEHGIGVFATHDIKQDTYLRLFGSETPETDVSVIRKAGDVPELFRSYCVYRKNDELVAPQDFGRIEICYYLNHSKNPNVYHSQIYDCYAKRDIRAGEEITIDYNELDEPEEYKQDYYK